MHLFVKLFAIISLTCLVAPNFGFILKPNASKGNQGRPLSLRALNYTEGAYYIQNVGSGLVITASDNGEPNGKKPYTGFALSESLEEANGNKTIESMLVWQMTEVPWEDITYFTVFKTLGPNPNNDFEGWWWYWVLYDVAVHMTSNYQFWDRGNGTFAMSFAALGVVGDKCVTDTGLHNPVDTLSFDCDETRTDQQWRLVKAEDWN